MTKDLHTGDAHTCVYVKTKKDADQLLNHAFPGFQKVKGIGHQKLKGGDVDLRIRRKRERFEKKGKAYHRDYAIGKDGLPVMHKEGKPWHEHPHIDINRGEGVKDIVHIVITG